MKRQILLFAYVMLSTSLAIGQTRTTTTTTTTVKEQYYVPAQPVMPDVTVPASPGSDYVWVREDWVWNPSKNTYEWRGGRWERMQINKEYVPGRWEKEDKGFKWKDGYWKAK